MSLQTKDLNFAPLTNGLGLYDGGAEAEKDRATPSPPIVKGLPEDFVEAAGPASPPRGLPLEIPSHLLQEVKSILKTDSPSSPALNVASRPQTDTSPLAQKQAHNLVEVLKESHPTKETAIPPHLGVIFFDLVTAFGVMILSMGTASSFLGISGFVSGFFQIWTLAACLVFYQLYSLIFHFTFQFTLGEQVFNVRLGTSKQRKSFLYFFLILWRSAVVFLSGFTLPVLSFLLKKDLVAMLVPLKVYKKL